MDNEKYLVDLLTADAVFRIAAQDIREDATDILTYGSPDADHLEIRRIHSTLAIKEIDCAYCRNISEGTFEIPVSAEPLKELEHLERVPFLETRDAATGYCRDFSVVFNRSELIIAFDSPFGTDQAAYIHRSGRLEFYINGQGSLLAVRIQDLSEPEYRALSGKRKKSESRKSRQAAKESLKAFFQRSWFIVLALLLFWPLGLFLMWKYAGWSRPAKIIITCFFAVGLICNIQAIR